MAGRNDLIEHFIDLNVKGLIDKEKDGQR